jgi:hypothetical protein
MHVFIDYVLEDIITKEDEMGRVTQMRRRMHIEYWWESQKVRDHWEDQELGG